MSVAYPGFRNGEGALRHFRPTSLEEQKGNCFKCFKLYHYLVHVIRDLILPITLPPILIGLRRISRLAPIRIWGRVPRSPVATPMSTALQQCDGATEVLWLTEMPCFYYYGATKVDWRHESTFNSIMFHCIHRGIIHYYICQSIHLLIFPSTSFRYNWVFTPLLLPLHSPPSPLLPPALPLFIFMSFGRTFGFWTRATQPPSNHRGVYDPTLIIGLKNRK